jgi:hypothetical protein
VGVDVVFHGLFAFDRRSVCELRVFEARDRRVVVATEVADNPGMSVVNAIESLARDVERDFGSLSTTLIVYAPAGEAFAPLWSEASVDAQGVVWNRTSREQVHDVVGIDLPEPVIEQHTMVAVAGDDHPLLGLLQPEEEFPPLGSRLMVVPVALLPWAHNPARCV